MKKILTITLCAALLCGFAACGAPKPGKLEKVTLVAENNTAGAWFSEEQPEDGTSMDNDPALLRVAKAPDGKETFSLLRLPLSGDIWADEVNSARLYLYAQQSSGASSLQVYEVGEIWTQLTTLAEARAAMGQQMPGAWQAEEGGWVSVDVTALVKDWLGGARPNYGLALREGSAGAETVFASGSGEDPQTTPKLELTLERKDHARGYGAFGYVQQPPEGAESDEGNCMSYALRDTDMILIDDLGADFDEMNRLYAKYGEDAVLKYFSGLVTEYVQAHKEALGISGFRPVGETDPIDPAKEYRIATRVGCKVFNDEIDLGGKGNFDYHFWAQLDDGRWAQKFPHDPSEIIPGTGPGVPIAAWPWDAALQWGNWKFTSYYDSKAVCFAVTKDTEAFTAHRGGVQSPLDT